jgi:hypothetical protein
MFMGRVQAEGVIAAATQGPSLSHQDRGLGRHLRRKSDRWRADGNDLMSLLDTRGNQNRFRAFVHSWIAHSWMRPGKRACMLTIVYYFAKWSGRSSMEFI